MTHNADKPLYAHFASPAIWERPPTERDGVPVLRYYLTAVTLRGRSLEFRSRGPWPPVGGTDSHACKVTRRIRVREKAKREVTAIIVERVSEETDGNF